MIKRVIILGGGSAGFIAALALKRKMRDLEVLVIRSKEIGIIGVGEATGAMDAMLAKIADFYDDEVDAAVEAMTSLMEPVMMVFLGTIIGGLVIAMYLPVFKLAGTISGTG